MRQSLWSSINAFLDVVGVQARPAGEAALQSLAPVRRQEERTQQEEGEAVR